MFDLETVRPWDKNPQVYADVIGTSLAGQALFAYAPEPERARRVVSKLRQVPRLVQAARDNIKECPGIFVKIGLETWRGTLKFIETDLPRAFSALDDLHILGDLADTSTEAAAAIKPYIDYLETDLAPRAKASFRLGRERFEQKLKLEEGITLSADRLLAIALRELGEVQEEFRTVAGRLNGGDPIEAWRKAKEQHPEAGRARAGRAGADQGARRVPAAPVHRLDARRPSRSSWRRRRSFYRWAFASMWTPGPFESKPSRAYYYLTDVDRSWPPERQEEHMRDFNFPTLWNISIHEVYPGALPPLPAPAAGRVEGAQVAVLRADVVRRGLGALLRADDDGGRASSAATPRSSSDSSPRRSSASPAFVVAIRLHCEDMSVEQGMRVLPRRGVPRGSHGAARGRARHLRPDVSRVLGGQAGDVEAAARLQGAAGRQVLAARRSTMRCSAQGSAPFWAHRRLLLGDTSDAVLE